MRGLHLLRYIYPDLPSHSLSSSNGSLPCFGFLLLPSQRLLQLSFLSNSKSQLDWPRKGQAKFDGVLRCRPTARLDRARGKAGTSKENACRALIKTGENLSPTAMAPLFIAPVAKPIKGQSHQSPHSTLSPSSIPSSTDDFIEHVLKLRRTTWHGKDFSWPIDLSSP